MATKRIPQTRFISKVQLLIGRIIVTTTTGKERSFPYERLTRKQEDTLRSMAQVIPTKQTIKRSRSRSASQPRRKHNYAAEVAGRCVLVSAGNGKESKLAVMEVTK